MAKKRRNKNGMTFKNALNLVKWDFNRIDDEEQMLFWGFEASIENFLEKRIEKLRSKLKTADERIREIASEAVQIAFEHQLIAYFDDVPAKPWKMTIGLSDFAEDGYSIELDIREPIREMLIERCQIVDGMVAKDHESEILGFAAMLDELSTELKTAVEKGK